MQKAAAILLLTLSLLCRHSLQAQSFFTGEEYGFAVGGSQYFGDLNDNYGFYFVRPAGGVFARIHLSPYVATRFTANYTKVGYNDAFSSNSYNKKRNLNFQSDIVEVAFQTEFNFMRFTTGELHSRFTPYITLGVGAFYYNPYTTYNGVRYNLKQVGTEGQYVGYEGRIYSNFNICFPLGIGVKYWVVPGVNVGFEIAHRLTLTDYLDDVSTTYVDRKLFEGADPSNPPVAYYLQDRSTEKGGDPLGRDGKQRGNSATKDQYMMFMFNLSFQFKTYKCPAYLKDGYFMY
jgi:hypothetical protein